MPQRSASLPLVAKNTAQNEQMKASTAAEATEQVWAVRSSNSNSNSNCVKKLLPDESNTTARVHSNLTKAHLRDYTRGEVWQLWKV